MATLQEIGRGLAGFGAGFQGQGPQFLASIEQGKQRELQSKQGARKRFINELGGAHSLIKRGNIIDAITLLSQSDDPNSQQIAVELQDPNQFEQTMSELNSTVNIATSLGELTTPEKGDPFTLSPGQTRFGPGGEQIATGGEKRQAGRDTLAQVQSSQILPNGSTVQVFKDGSTRVTGPQGRILKGQERQDGIEAAQEFGIEIQSRRAGGRTGATQTEQRAGALITRGIAAAESTATVRRAIELLDRVKTGGIAAISLATMKRLGIEGADEGELSNSLGKSVLSQLRETFGAAFTESEGLRLERIEAGFGKSTESNRRLLGQALRIAERTANRAIKAAKKRGNMAEVADIEDLLSFSLDIEDAQPAQQEGQPAASGPQEGATATNPQTGQQITFRNGSWQ